LLVIVVRVDFTDTVQNVLLLQVSPLIGARFRCGTCKKDICSSCYTKHDKNHKLTVEQANHEEVTAEEEQGQQFYALAVVGIRNRSGIKEYNVRWETDGPCKDSWEPESFAEQCPALVQHFLSCSSHSRGKKCKRRKLIAA
jgi:hypothetical protein